jgi:flagellar basal-body rod protein FlgG
MNGSLRTSASGMAAQQKMIEVISNNLANVNTTGFKRSRVAFQDVLYETIAGARPAGDTPVETTGPAQVGRGVRVAAVARIHGQGALETTGRSLDIAIEGDGFFQVQRPDMTVAYTRDGSFTLSDTGAIVTNDGYPVLPGLFVPPDASEVTVSSTGLVSATVSGQTMPVEIGRLELARFINPSGLMTIGQNLLVETPASGEPIAGFPDEDGAGRLLQGALESSNVEIVQEMTDMIAAQRAYEINARGVQVADEMLRATGDLVR